MPGTVSIRANKDNKGWGRLKRCDIGKAGDSVMHKQLGAFGKCISVQFEIQMTDDLPLELVALEWKVTELS